jgi:hypothetical protein
VRAHLLQQAGVRLLVGDGVPRASAADRRARVALGCACQRVRTSAPRHMTPLRRPRVVSSAGREGERSRLVGGSSELKIVSHPPTLYYEYLTTVL